MSVPKQLQLRIARPMKVFGAFLLVFLGPGLTASLGQVDHRSVKFDEITGFEKINYGDPTVEKRIERFLEMSKRERNRVPYVLHYRARIRDGTGGKSSDWASHLRWRLNRDDVLILDGGVRERETLELWFKSRTGDLPAATPTFERSEAIDCPRIFVWREDFEFDKTKPIIFKASLYPNTEAAFKWTPTDGVIVGESSSNVVTVDVSKVKAERITIYAQVLGLSSLCKDTETADADIGPKPRLLDTFGMVPNGDIRARLDNFLSTLAQNRDLRGYVYVYGDRTKGKVTSAARHRLFSNHFRFRNFDLSRITLRDAGYRDTVSTDLWLVPPNVEPPVSSPTVDSIFVDRPPRRKRPLRR